MLNKNINEENIDELNKEFVTYLKNKINRKFKPSKKLDNNDVMVLIDQLFSYRPECLIETYIDVYKLTNKKINENEESTFIDIVGYIYKLCDEKNKINDEEEIRLTIGDMLVYNRDIGIFNIIKIIIEISENL